MKRIRTHRRRAGARRARRGSREGRLVGDRHRPRSERHDHDPRCRRRSTGLRSARSPRTAATSPRCSGRRPTRRRERPRRATSGPGHGPLHGARPGRGQLRHAGRVPVRQARRGHVHEAEPAVLGRAEDVRRLARRGRARQGRARQVRAASSPPSGGGIDWTSWISGATSITIALGLAALVFLRRRPRRRHPLPQ